MVRRVAVIGAGAGGLASVKCCLDEGLEPTCFESSEDIGGVWRYTDSTDSRRITVYRSVITNTSKEMSCFSDFPFPEDFPNYLPHSLVLEYLRMYAQHFDLLRHIRFQTTVLSVRKCPDFSTSGRWEVVTESHGVRESHVFDAVMVCTGHYQEPYLPLASFPGVPQHQEPHMGRQPGLRPGLPHGHGQHHPLQLPPGLASPISPCKEDQVSEVQFMVQPHKLWLGLQQKVDFSSCFVGCSGGLYNMKCLILSFGGHFWNSKPSEGNCDHKKSHSRSLPDINTALFSAASSKFKIIINEELPFCLLSGAVVLKPNVKEFTESSAVFEDGTTEENIDVVLFATGYNFSFPFLEESVRGSIHDNRSLYNCVFPPQLEQPTLAIIGLIQLTGSIMVGSEMQARWVTGVFAGWNKLPPPSRMMAEVLKMKPAIKRNPPERENLKMSFISYVDKIAACAGVKPSVLRLLLTDPKLGLAIFFGPCSPYQYRLQGRGSWSGARAAILTQWQRSLRPLRTRVLRDSSSSSWGWSWMCLLALPAALTAAWLCSKYPQAGWSPRL
uniref:Flavin-containing monooxygenase n=1 Tax=Junco hyemalis TaxID=40217 RepID=A0A8C5J4T9_JUNHY